jgi:hypothetical protein
MSKVFLIVNKNNPAMAFGHYRSMALCGHRPQALFAPRPNKGVSRRGDWIASKRSWELINP